MDLLRPWNCADLAFVRKIIATADNGGRERNDDWRTVCDTAAELWLAGRDHGQFLFDLASVSVATLEAIALAEMAQDGGAVGRTDAGTKLA
jgi:hypothetical protein